jgi:hypothetical protein
MRGLSARKKGPADISNLFETAEEFVQGVRKKKTASSNKKRYDRDSEEESKTRNPNSKVCAGRAAQEEGASRHKTSGRKKSVAPFFVFPALPRWANF